MTASETLKNDEQDVVFTLHDMAPFFPNYAALLLSSGRVLEIHGGNEVKLIGAFLRAPSDAQEPSFILRNPDGSIEHSGAFEGIR